MWRFAIFSFPSAKYLLAWNLIKYMIYLKWQIQFVPLPFIACEMHRNQFGDLESFNGLYCFYCETVVQIFPMYVAVLGAITITKLLTHLTIFSAYKKSFNIHIKFFEDENLKLQKLQSLENKAKSGQFHCSIHMDIWWIMKDTIQTLKQAKHTNQANYIDQLWFRCWEWRW